MSAGLRPAGDFMDWTDDKKEELARRYGAGESWAEIGKALGCSENAVHQARHKFKIPMRPRKKPVWTRVDAWELQLDEFRKRWAAGESYEDIADALGRTKGAVQQARTKFNLPMRGQGGPRDMSKSRRKRKKKSRKLCLRCNRPMNSAGFHNRVCDACREANRAVVVEEYFMDTGPARSAL